jgi:hypothetical protein
LARGLAFSALLVGAAIASRVGAASLDWLQRSFAEPPDAANGNIAKVESCFQIYHCMEEPDA